MGPLLKGVGIAGYLLLAAAAPFRRIEYRTRLLVSLFALYAGLAIVNLAFPSGPYAHAGVITLPIFALVLLGASAGRIAILASTIIVLSVPLLLMVPGVVRALGIDPAQVAKPPDLVWFRATVKAATLVGLMVLLVDDHPAVREGLGLLLAPEGIAVCAEAGRRPDALAQAEERRPDLAIVDLSLDGEDGVALIADLYQYALPVLVYSMHSDPRHVQAAVAAGALGYVTKREFHDVLVQAIREIAAGRRFVSPIAAAALVESVTESPADGAAQKLSPHEQKVYEMLGQGADTFDIAAVLHVSNHTVETYYSRILVKLSLNGMLELRRHAIGHFQKQKE